MDSAPEHDDDTDGRQDAHDTLPAQRTPPLQTSPTIKTEPLTPPITPEKADATRPLVSGNLVKLDLSSSDGGQRQDPVQAEAAHESSLNSLPVTPLLYTQPYKRLQELGHGAWSTVYTAEERDHSSIQAVVHLPPSPPNSPPSNNRFTSRTNRVVAVKVPSRRDANPILEFEARVLTYLRSHPHYAAYVVPFRGFDITTHSLVMSAVPLTLENYVKARMPTKVSTKTMFDPILGLDRWMRLATSLIEGLSFLHQVRVVHGDIKPANILMQDAAHALPCIRLYEEPEDRGPGDKRDRVMAGEETWRPLYADFSSALLLASSSVQSDLPSAENAPIMQSITAVTPSYTAPELLASLHRPSASAPAVATKPADVFALGVTLLFAALGEAPYAFARMDIQKLSMAREGRPIEFARNGDQGARVRKDGAVERCLKGALDKEPEKRWKIENWLDLVLQQRGAQKVL